MAFPQIVGSSLSSNAGTNTIDDSVTLPASIVSGDLIIVFHYSDGGVTRTFPSPWVEIKDTSIFGDEATIGIAYLIASGGESSVTVTKSITERFSAIAIRISSSSWHGTTPPEVSTGVAVDKSFNPDPDALNPSGWGTEDTLWIAVCGYDTSATASSISVYPYASNNIIADHAGSAGGGGIATTESAAELKDPGTFTISPQQEWWAGTIAVRPQTGSTSITVPVASLSLVGFAPASTDVFYVDGATGNDGNDGLTTGAAWATIGKANSTLVAGDTVNILAGTYNERINPANNGSSGSLITYKQHLSESVTIAGVSGSSSCVKLDPSSFIAIDGLILRYGHAARNHSIVNISGSSATDNIIRNCTIDQPGTSSDNDAAGWKEFGVGVRSSAADNLIEDCTLRGIRQGIHMNNGCLRTTVRGCTIDDTFDSCITIRTSSSTPYQLWGHLIEDNVLANSVREDGIQTESDQDASDPTKVFSALGIIIRNNIIRDNGENAIDLKGAANIVIEGNTIYGTVGSSGGAGNRNALRAISRGASRVCKDFIIRHNILYDNGNGIHIRGDNYKMYHNTMVANNRDFTGTNSTFDDDTSFWGIRHDSASHDNQAFKNNIVVFHNKVSGHFHPNGTMDIDYNCYDGPWSFFSSLPPSSLIDTLAAWRTELEGDPDYSGEEANSIEVADVGAVKFVNVPNDKTLINGSHTGFDFGLKVDSPCVNAGGPLTATTDGGEGTAIPLDDASYFFDGYGANGVVGDTIVVGTEAVTITAINYGTNVITISASISWTIDAPVYWPFEGSAPDIGARDVGATSVPSASLALTGQSPLIIVGVQPIASVPVADLSVTGFAPFVVPPAVIVDVGALTLVGYSPAILTSDIVLVVRLVGGPGHAKAVPKRKPPSLEELERDRQAQVSTASVRMAANSQQIGEAQQRARTREVPKMSPEFDRVANKKVLPPEYEAVIFHFPEDKRKKK